MRDYKVMGVAIVDEMNRLVGNFSASDLMVCYLLDLILFELHRLLLSVLILMLMEQNLQDLSLLSEQVLPFLHGVYGYDKVQQPITQSPYHDFLYLSL